MSWKLFITAFISALFIAFPQNMIGCGDGEDPYDYYTSLFSKGLTDKEKIYEPFYYTALLDFYDDWQWDKPVDLEKDPVLQEWKVQCKGAVSTSDAAGFVYNAKRETVDSLIRTLRSAAALRWPSSVKDNALARCLAEEKQWEKLSYLSFAKKTEGVSTGADWEAKETIDSNTVNAYIAEADKAFNATNDSFLKTKYAFQRCKLAFYNSRFDDCIRWYDSYFTGPSKGAVHQLALSYKAGSLFRLGKNAEAAYNFSLAFPLADHNKKSVYLGFLWATNECDSTLQNDVLAFAKTDSEKATVLGMFSLFGQTPKLQNLQAVYTLQPASPLLPVMAIREINKLEEQYLTPLLSSEKGGKAYYYFWTEDSAAVPDQQPLTAAIQLFQRLAGDKKAGQNELYTMGAAYLSFMKKDYAEARSLLGPNERFTKPELKDQAQLLNLLITINESKALDEAFENKLLPSLTWLVNKAKTDKEYETFLRNTLSEILAQKYEQQNHYHKAALAYGAADLKMMRAQGAEEGNYNYGVGLDYIRNEMQSADLLKLYALQGSTAASPFEKALISYSSFNRDDVVDVLGTAYLRTFEFAKAAEWLKKAGKPETLVATKYNWQTDKETIINVNPFHDYLNDWQRYDKPVAKPFTKLSFAQKVLELQHKSDTAKSGEAKARLWYQLASAHYNMSYYGNSWNAVAYDRSGSDWNMGTYDQPWKKEYYGVHKAKEYYQKAYETTRDKEFKAAAFFMTLKCAQRQIPMPAYNYDNYEQYEKSYQAFEKQFRNNPQFATFKRDFGTTKFYQYTVTRCSYLYDFVKAQSKGGK